MKLWAVVLMCAGACVAGFGKETPLVEAARKGNVALVKKWIASGADVNERNEWGETALVVAAHEGETVLLSMIAMGNVTFGDDKDGKQRAEIEKKVAKAKGTRKQYVGAVKALLAAGADVNAKSEKGETALSVAKGKKVIKVLKAAGAK